MAGKIVIEIETGNSAFTPEINREAGRIIAELADKIRDDVAIAPFPLKDINGNTVGYLNFITDASQKLRAERIIEIENEIADACGRLRRTGFDHGGRVGYYQVQHEEIEYIKGLLEELETYPEGEKYYE